MSVRRHRRVGLSEILTLRVAMAAVSCRKFLHRDRVGRPCHSHYMYRYHRGGGGRLSPCKNRARKTPGVRSGHESPKIVITCGRFAVAIPHLPGVSRLPSQLVVTYDPSAQPATAAMSSTLSDTTASVLPVATVSTAPASHADRPGRPACTAVIHATTSASNIIRARKTATMATTVCIYPLCSRLAGIVGNCGTIPAWHTLQCGVGVGS